MLRRELSAAVRSIARTPIVFLVLASVVAIVTGPTALVASFLSSAVLRPLGISRAEEVRVVRSRLAGSAVGQSQRPEGLSFPDFVDLRDALGQGTITAALPAAAALGEPSRTRVVHVAAVTNDYFELLGVRPRLGAVLPKSGMDHTDARIVVLSENVWREQLDSDPRVVGRSVPINGHSFTIVGIAPAGFHGASRSERSDAWVPFGSVGLLLEGEDLLGFRDARQLVVYVRSQTPSDDVRLKTVFERVSDQLGVQFPATNAGRLFTGVPVELGLLQQLRSNALVQALMLALVTMGLVVLLACGSIAAVSIARAASREHEVAVRVALGATRTSIVLRPLIESVASSVVGGLGGVGLAAVTVAWVKHSSWQQNDMSVDAFTFCIVTVCALLTGCVAGGMAAATSLRAEPGLLLRVSGPAVGRYATRLQRVILAGQLAMAFVLGSLAVMVALNAARLGDQPLGFDIRRLSRVEIALGEKLTSAERAVVLDAIQHELLQIPGVSAASIAGSRLLSGDAETVHPVSLPEAPRGFIATSVMLVTENFFKTLAIDVRRGRMFDANDRPQQLRPAIINETMARRFWPGRDPVGREFLDRGRFQRQVIGVIADTKGESLEEDAHLPRYYALVYAVPLQRFAVYVRLRQTGADSAAILAAIRMANPRGAIEGGLEALTVARDSRLAPYHAVAGGAAALAALALVIALVAVFGLTSHAVASRRLEFGIRVAIGATPWAIARLIFLDILAVCVVGLGIGLAIQLAAVGALGSTLHQTSVTLAWAVSGTALLLMTAVVAAAARPAWLAATRPPTDTLRN